MIPVVFPAWFYAVAAAWKALWSFLGPLGNLIQWVFQTKEGFYLFVKRQQFRLLNSTTWWSASFRFDVPEERLEQVPTLMTAAVASLADLEGFQIFRDLPENKTVRAGGIIFEFDCSGGYLHIQVSDQKISFRDSKRLIESQLFPLLERIETSLGQCTRQYSLTAKFGSKRNPYLSTHLARLNNRLIIAFQCAYNLGESGDMATVSIGVDSVSVIANSRERFRSASLRVLALSNA
jgi:hypothetical protein